MLLLVCSSYRTFVWAFHAMGPRYMAWTSGIRAKRAFYRAVRDVPAYAKFVAERVVGMG